MSKLMKKACLNYIKPSTKISVPFVNKTLTTVCASIVAFSICSLPSYAAMDSSDNFDRITTIESRDIPEVYTKLPEDAQQLASGIGNLIDEIECQIAQIEHNIDKNEVTSNDKLSTLEAEVDAIKAIID